MGGFSWLVQLHRGCTCVHTNHTLLPACGSFTITAHVLSSPQWFAVLPLSFSFPFALVSSCPQSPSGSSSLCFPPSLIPEFYKIHFCSILKYPIFAPYSFSYPQFCSFLRRKQLCISRRKLGSSYLAFSDNRSSGFQWTNAELGDQKLFSLG